LRAAWDLTEASERDALGLLGRPLSMALASAHFDAGEPRAARTCAARALAGEDPAAPRGDVVYEMNALLGRLALGEDDVEGAARFLLAASKTPGSACWARSART
jgi:hypothetical protein